MNGGIKTDNILVGYDKYICIYIQELWENIVN